MPSLQDGSNSKPASDEELQKFRVGELKPHNAPITLVEYDPRWPELFDREADRVRSILGNKALRVEHVGSTSVPGLCAKPIIDMLLVVADSADEPSYVPALEAAGYTLRIREPEWFEHRMFKGPDIDINLHVFSAGMSEIERMLRFRDWLRANDTDRDNYARAKRNLAQRVWRHVQHYADAKTSIIQEIMDRANAAK
ncbi:GrpB family protein [Kroppenstedtia eburnea]|uniref:GrpB family protein n=1 Tax=Kroppenstedtia eburnea TaxID=714067 RepID=UPI00363E23F2